jgi:HemK-related putative methylase
VLGSDTPGRPDARGPGVYPPREDTLLLAPFARLGPGRLVLDLGCGNGLLALTAARSGADVVATDLNPYALRALRRYAHHEHLALEIVRTDLGRGLGRFDVVLCNPPYLPTSPELRDPDRWHNLALDGGPDGLAVTARVLAALPRHLRPGGVAYVLFSSLQPAIRRRMLRDRWMAHGGRWTRVARRALEGEVLEVVRLVPSRATSRAGPSARPARRRIADRPRAPRPEPRRASSRGGGRGRRRARGAA